MHLFIPITLIAAALQTARFSLQKQLKTLGLSTLSATAARFVTASPLAIMLAAIIMVWRGYGWPSLAASFWPVAAAGGVAQIAATFFTVSLFSQRSFAVGIAFTKTEVLQVALFSALFLGERVSGGGLASILLGVLGVLILTRPVGGWKGDFLDKATLLGLAAGALFGVASVGYRAATLAVGNDDAFFRAVFSLAAVTTMQTLVLLPWLIWRDRGEVARIAAARRPAFWAGVTGMLASLCWFWAFALMNAAYVRAIGQVELVFTLAVSTYVFRERPRKRELFGIALLALSIIGIVLSA
ncbi:MAG: EamA family transporter [Cypionkella sp.]